MPTMQSELDRFEQFLFEMDDVLEQFLAAASSAGFDLDYSLSSLESLEEYILGELTESGNSELVKNRAARYLGELFRKNVGGRWQLCLKNPKYLYYKLPVIVGHADRPIEFCPIQVIRNFIRMKRRGMLRTAVESHLEFKA
jgi:hypothetical protein